MIKILVIEDEANIRREVMDWLRFEGYAVIGAENGRAGLAAVHQEAPDLILCDVAMPELSGHEVLSEVRSGVDSGQIPFIFLTAAADRGAMRRGMELGADDYLTKPFTHAEVFNAVRTRLGKKSAQDAQVQNQLDTLNLVFAEEREKRLLKSRIVAMFAHDFRNPLNWILMSSEILRSQADRLTPERRDRQLDRIDSAVHQLLQMLDDMLTVAEVESGRLGFAAERVELPPFIETTLDELRLMDQGAHRFTLHTNARRFITADPKLLKRILANLLTNAMKFSPPETEITLSIYEVPDAICFEVQDQGLGIPAESLPRLFEPFHRASNIQHTKGSGLGLTIVKECVERHHGVIEVASDLDQGTTFTVRLPTV